MMLKKAAKSKTLWFAIVLAALGAIEASFDVLQPLMSPAFFGIFCVAISVTIAVLRIITTSSISEK